MSPHLCLVVVLCASLIVACGGLSPLERSACDEMTGGTPIEVTASPERSVDAPALDDLRRYGVDLREGDYVRVISSGAHTRRFFASRTVPLSVLDEQGTTVPLEAAPGPLAGCSAIATEASVAIGEGTYYFSFAGTAELEVEVVTAAAP